MLSFTSFIIKPYWMPMNMALHAARVIRQRHKHDAEQAETDISPEQRRNLEEAFEAADKNGDGVLSAEEYYEIFQTHGLAIGNHNYVNKFSNKQHSYYSFISWPYIGYILAAIHFDKNSCILFLYVG